MFERRGQKRKQAKPAADNASASVAEAAEDIRPAPPGAVPTRQAAPAAPPPPRMPAGGSGSLQGGQSSPGQTSPGQTSPGQSLPPSAPPRAAAPVVGQAPIPPAATGGRPDGMRRAPDPVQPVAPPPTLTPPSAAPAAPAPTLGANQDAPSGITAMSSYAPGSSYAAGSATGLSAADSGKLIVGRDIELTGQIKNCELLVVEGVVEATLVDTKALEVTERGIFRGTAPVEKAYVAGLVEGDLIVDGHVMIRSTGVVNGNVRFDEIEIERGGRVRGSMQQITDEDLGADAGSGADDAAGD